MTELEGENLTPSKRILRRKIEDDRILRQKRIETDRSEGEKFDQSESANLYTSDNAADNTDGAGSEDRDNNAAINRGKEKTRARQKLAGKLTRASAHVIKRILKDCEADCEVDRVEVSNVEVDSEVEQTQQELRRMKSVTTHKLVRQAVKLDQTAVQIADRFASEYSLKSDERRQVIRQVRTARMSQRSLAKKICRMRWKFTEEGGKRRFIEWLDEYLSEIEGHTSESDEG